MASNLKQTRIQQKQRFLRLLSERKAALLAQGANEEKIKKDRAVKHLLAEIKRTGSAIASIGSREQVIQTAKLQRQEKIAKAAEEAPKAKRGKQKTEVEVLRSSTALYEETLLSKTILSSQQVSIAPEWGRMGICNSPNTPSRRHVHGIGRQSVCTGSFAHFPSRVRQGCP